MRKRFFILIAVLISVLACVQAQPLKRSVTVGVFGGLDIPVFNTTFRDYWNNGSNLGLESQIHLSDKITLCPRIAYHRFGLNQDRLFDKFGSAVHESGGRIVFHKGQRSLWELALQLQFYLSQPEDMVGFYLTLGGSYNALFYETAEGAFEKSDQEYFEILREKVTFQGYGPHAGFGLDYWMASWFSVYSEARFHFLKTTLTPFRPVNDHEVEFVFYHDSNKLAYISVLWGAHISL